MNRTRNRLADLLLNPQESLDVEYKGWVELAGNDQHKALLAKAIMALANSGGGFVVVGFTEKDGRLILDQGRPPTLDDYSQDLINAVVRNYAEPAFHCAVHHIEHPSSGLHPIIGVPGGHRVPVRARRSGPSGQVVQQHAVYIRKPGPRSEQPLTAREWDDLFARCLDARRDELLERVRDLLQGTTSAQAEEAQLFPLEGWIRSCLDIWKEKVEALPPESPSRCPHGYYVLAYALDAPQQRTLEQLLAILRDAPHLTGWNVWWTPTRREITPYVSDGAIECWIGGDTSEHPKDRDSAHSDFWRVSPDGLAFLLRGYQEDGERAASVGIEPGTALDAELPIWRVGEGLLHAAYLGEHLASASLTFSARYTGVRGRSLTMWVNPMGGPWAGGTSKDDSVVLSTHVETPAVSPNLADIIQALLVPLYERFDFSRLPLEVVRREVERLRKRK